MNKTFIEKLAISKKIIEKYTPYLSLKNPILEEKDGILKNWYVIFEDNSLMKLSLRNYHWWGIGLVGYLHLNEFKNWNLPNYIGDEVDELYDFDYKIETRDNRLYIVKLI